MLWLYVSLQTLHWLKTWSSLAFTLMLLFLLYPYPRQQFAPAIHSYPWHCMVSDRLGLLQARGSRMLRHGIWDVFFRRSLLTQSFAELLLPNSSCAIMPLVMTNAFPHSSCTITPVVSRNTNPTWFLNHPSLWRAYVFLPLHWHSANTMSSHLTLSQFTRLSARWSTSATVCTHVCMHTHPTNPNVEVLKRESKPVALMFSQEAVNCSQGKSSFSLVVCGGGVCSFHLPLVGWSVSFKDCFGLWPIKRGICIFQVLYWTSWMTKVFQVVLCSPPFQCVPSLSVMDWLGDGI